MIDDSIEKLLEILVIIVRYVGIQGYAVAKAPTGVARALLYCTVYNQGLSTLPSSSIIQVILQYLSSRYSIHQNVYYIYIFDTA